MSSRTREPSTKEKILQATLALVRTKGFTATTVDDLCAAAGVTKGAFFHHFESKEALGVDAARYWSEMTTAFFAAAPYQTIVDPLAKLLGYIDYRIAILKGNIPEWTCLVGTMVQETYDSSPAIRQACRDSIFGHADEVARMIDSARKRYAPKASWNAKNLALHTQAVIQGSFILAKAGDSASIAADSIRHLRRYIELLIKKPNAKEKS